MSSLLLFTSDFYLQCMVFTATWWILVCSITKRSLFHVMEGSVLTVPSWMPETLLLQIQQRHKRTLRPLLFYAQSFSFALAFSFRENAAIVLVAAMMYSLYHLVETSETNRHGEYPILYSVWAIYLVAVFRPETITSGGAATTRTIAYFENEVYRQACVWGVAIHFVFSAGYSKLTVSGWASWLSPKTMQTYLTCYHQARHAINRPIWMNGNRLVAKSNLLSTLAAFCILTLECIVVPVSLLLDETRRHHVAYLLIAMHVAISLFLSCKVGFSFWTTIPVYLYGFSCPAEFASPPWFLALAIGFGPTMMATMFRGGHSGDGSGSILPENWPCTPVGLFMWDGSMAEALSQLLMTGDTRLVLTTPEVAANGLVGLRIMYQGEHRPDDEIEGENNNTGAVVHDAVLRTIGFTLVQGEDTFVEVLRNMKEDKASNCSLAIETLVHRTWAWLSVERRLFDAHTGEALTCAFFVRIDTSSGTIKEVLQ